MTLYLSILLIILLAVIVVRQRIIISEKNAELRQLKYWNDMAQKRNDDLQDQVDNNIYRELYSIAVGEKVL
jgi:cell division protein FtsB